MYYVTSPLVRFRASETIVLPGVHTFPNLDQRPAGRFSEKGAAGQKPMGFEDGSHRQDMTTATRRAAIPATPGNSWMGRLEFGRKDRNVSSIAATMLSSSMIFVSDLMQCRHIRHVEYISCAMYVVNLCSHTSRAMLGTSQLLLYYTPYTIYHTIYTIYHAIQITLHQRQPILVTMLYLT